MPQVRGIVGWHSEIRAALGGKTEELERLAVQMYARGLSMRDIEQASTDGEGHCVRAPVMTPAASSKTYSEKAGPAKRLAPRSCQLGNYRIRKYSTRGRLSRWPNVSDPGLLITEATRSKSSWKTMLGLALAVSR
jgi:hypothetical protein